MLERLQQPALILVLTSWLLSLLQYRLGSLGLAYVFVVLCKTVLDLKSLL